MPTYERCRCTQCARLVRQILLSDEDHSRESAARWRLDQQAFATASEINQATPCRVFTNSPQFSPLTAEVIKEKGICPTIRESSVLRGLNRKKIWQQSVSRIGEARNSFGQIRESVDVIRDMNTQIATAAEEQHQVAQA
ncbi:methyl-accepting chemotaxis protein [Pseudomonas sp. H3(2019)]|uniref:methyl-accepting chemotaxis protein n=1 Tax=Pseudomonas sp. H3(2019) TaxID=2598724 RepID=UPI0011903576|nr:methyl-accepting chemotaxis protein [Pseudomonas sp. H3(2019)]TVT79250.1 methyl-accepting chemotaxis protein [Pseudomonas sp. H3(2019)]